jgi:hypothetical protein
MREIYGELKKLASKYADREISIDDFRVDFAGLYFHARQSKRDQKANLLANKIIGPLAEFSLHHRDEESFRQELAAAIQPFEKAPRYYAVAQKIVYGPPPVSAFSVNQYYQLSASVQA